MLAGLAFTVLLSAAFAASAQAELTEHGDLFVAFSGGISPGALSRHAPTAISVNVAGKIRTLSGEDPPALRRIAIDLNRRGDLDTRGLPACRATKIESASLVQALDACGAAIVGGGGFAAATTFPEESTFPTRGHILAFNGRQGGHRVILAYVYGPKPVPSTRVVVFHIGHTVGTYGTILTATLPTSLNRYGYLRRISLTLHRRFTYRGASHSYLSASCPAPSGFTAAVFPFVRASMTFDDGTTLSSVLTRSCSVRPR